MKNLKVGIPKEIMPEENRVAATPETVKTMVSEGAAVKLESGAGLGCFFSDDAYRMAGATVVETAEQVYTDSDVILKVKEPRMNEATGRHETDLMRKGQTLICFLHPATPRNHGMVHRLAERGVQSLTLDGVPRMAKTQAMDALSSMSLVAGYKGFLMAADQLSKFVPFSGSAVGMIPPSKLLVVGAGVAGLQALATGKRLGATVVAAEIRPEGREQAVSLGAVTIDTGVPADMAVGKGGYARDLPGEVLEKERQTLRPHIKDSDILILTALVPGRVAPVLVTEEMVAGMKPGSVIVDISIDQGGNCILTDPGRTVSKHGVHIIGIQNIPGRVPVTSTWLFSRNILNFLKHVLRGNSLVLDRKDEVIASSLVTIHGEIVHAGALEAMAAVTKAGGA